MYRYFILVVCVVFTQNLFARKASPVHSSQEKSTTFLAIGDWGMHGIASQRAVAAAMATVVAQSHASFIVTTGDNFYDDGVESKCDSGFQQSFEQVYKQKPLQIPWYVSLGNHDYRGNVDAEIAYSKSSHRWHLPARYYTKEFRIGHSKDSMLLVFIDTDPFFEPYYSDSLYRDKVMGQDTASQKHWIDTVLAASRARWKFVIGHHPVITGGPKMNQIEVRSVHDALQPLLDKHHVNAYICGHAHYLEYIRPPGSTYYFISGAGAESKKATLYPKFGAFAAGPEIYGFMSFTVYRNKFMVKIIDSHQTVLYRTTILHQ